MESNKSNIGNGGIMVKMYKQKYYIFKNELRDKSANLERIRKYLRMSSTTLVNDARFWVAKDIEYNINLSLFKSRWSSTQMMMQDRNLIEVQYEEMV